jgi:DNA-binding NarL/FixJ family response regulator
METTCRTVAPPTILIVEDQDVMRRALCDLVEDSFPESTILETGEVAAARQICEEHAPQLAILDVLLPDHNGIMLTAALRSMKVRPEVIVISSLSDPIYHDLALAFGARAYIVKDHLLAELVPAMAKALNKIPPRGPR